MTAWSDANLLDVWARGRAESPQMRAVALLEASDPSETAAELINISVGQRDARLLEFRRRVFGDSAEALADCPACASALEFSLAMSDFETPAPRSHANPITLGDDGWEVTFRLPNAGDMVSLSQQMEFSEARAAIMRRCVLRANSEGRTVAGDRLPEEVIERMAEEMAKGDPIGAINLSLSCPACGERWEAPFDIVSFVWTELDAFARGLIGEVHELASAYGWSERDILSMEGSRRRLYMQMIGV
jgi:hypothetical protein